MIPEIGHLALVIALVLALCVTTVPLWGAWRGNMAADAPGADPGPGYHGVSA
jgi:cytochrome c biogenesis factor